MTSDHPLNILRSETSRTSGRTGIKGWRKAKGEEAEEGSLKGEATLVQDLLLKKTLRPAFLLLLDWTNHIYNSTTCRNDPHGVPILPLFFCVFFLFSSSLHLFHSSHPRHPSSSTSTSRLIYNHLAQPYRLPFLDCFARVATTLCFALWFSCDWRRVRSVSLRQNL